MQKRIEYIDIAKGLAICLMVFGHSGYAGLPHEVIYTFHMPLFFFLSGLFVGREKISIVDSIKANSRRLLLPYFFMYLISIPFGLAFIYYKCSLQLNTVDCLVKPIFGMLYGVDHLIDKSYFFTNGPLWFLLALFLSRIWFDISQIVLKRVNGGGVFLSAIISVSTYYLLKLWGVNVWSLAQACILYPYLLFGYVLSRTSFLTKVDTLSNLKKILICTLLFVVVVLTTKYLGKIDYGSLLIGTYPVISFFIAIIGILSITLLSSAIQNSWFCQLGKETLVVLGFHHPIMDVVKYCLSGLGVDVFSYSLGICLIITLITLAVCHFTYLILRNTVPVLIGIKAK